MGAPSVSAKLASFRNTPLLCSAARRPSAGCIVAGSALPGLCEPGDIPALGLITLCCAMLGSGASIPADTPL